MTLEHQSIWKLTAQEAKKFPPLSTPVSTDIAIVGGGISGLTCAYILGKAGRKVIVLEAHNIGVGTTGHSTGNLYGIVDQHLSKLKSKWGFETAKEVVSSRLAAVDFIERTVKQNNLECNFERVLFTYFAENLNDTAREFLEKEANAASKLGLIVALKKTAALPFPTSGALEVAGQAQFHPLNYTIGLSKIMPAGVQIFENSPVIDIDYKTKTLLCPNGSVTANHIILATHIPKGFASVQLRMSPIREHGIAAEVKNELFKGIFWGVNQPKRSIRTLQSNGKNFVITVGDKFKTGHNADPSMENDILSRYLSERLPLGGQKYWWAAQSYRSGDGLPFMGEQKDNIYTLTGFSTDGLTYGTLGAILISDLILGKDNPWSERYQVKRKTLLKSVATISKEGLDNFCQYARDLPKFGTVSEEEIKAGAGGIVERNGEKLAVYRDENSKLHALSAVCTHMKCIVTFNKAEKTWDCPCHASRFKTDGTVIEGPALLPLERRKL
jgi:glycine/D-amino acid oxidase-like deaminating enzyme/nitrite reductase/ring-hydroxylating ferredoxin subunit